MKPGLIAFTNGFEGTWPTIEYGARLAANMQAHLTLMGIVEQNDEAHPVEDIFSRAVPLLRELQVDYALELNNRPAEEAIIEKSKTSGDEILVLGPFGRPSLRRALIGRTFRQLMAAISAPMLYVPAVRLPIRKVLICTGGLGYSLTTENLAFKVAQMSNAQVTLLSVVPPINIDYPEARKIRDNLSNLADSDTLIGRNLREGLENARQAGLQAEIKIRHGNIVEEILADIKEENYDLVCMGSQHSAHGLRQLYTPNVTADVAEVAQCPLLTARYMADEK